MKYTSINKAINSDGLRLVIVKAMPSAWGVAVKAMMEYKGLDFMLAHQIPMSENPELLAWSGTNSGPVAAWNDEVPINRWNDILFLLERLAPEKPLVPKNATARIEVLGISHEICGELGFGWNRRLDMMRPPKGESPSDFGKKYSYRDAEAALANKRVIALMTELATRLKAQAGKGSEFLVGDSITAADFYWAAFSNFIVIQPHEECPINPQARPMFENTPAEIVSAIDPILIEHRDRIMRTYYKLPLEL
jgi:glutathione S-transferase